MKYIRLFENFDDIIDDINLILVNLSDSTSNPITDYKKYFGNSLLIYDLNIKDDRIDGDEAMTANKRLKDIGYQILQISRKYDNSTWLALIIKNDLFSKLKDNDITFWKDLKWKDWHLNKIMNVKSKYSKLKLGESKNEDDNNIISIIDGKISEFNNIKIEFNVRRGYKEDEYYFYDKCLAEYYLLWIQVEYFGINIK